jgi:hypothetical protein
MVSGSGIPQKTSMPGTETAAAGKKQWVAPVVHSIDLETAEYHHASRSPDAAKPSRIA